MRTFSAAPTNTPAANQFQCQWKSHLSRRLTRHFAFEMEISAKQTSNQHQQNDLSKQFDDSRKKKNERKNWEKTGHLFATKWDSLWSVLEIYFSFSKYLDLILIVITTLGWNTMLMMVPERPSNAKPMWKWWGWRPLRKWSFSHGHSQNACRTKSLGHRSDLLPHMHRRHRPRQTRFT